MSIVLFLTITTSMNAQISGKVFRDNNGNGVRDSSIIIVEPYLQGITITAFPISGSTQVANSSVSGAYSFTGLTLPVRLEFTTFGNGYFSGPQTTNSASSVQFYSSNTTVANFGIINTEFYCQENPPIAVSFTPGTSNFISGLSSPSGIRLYSLSGLTTSTNEFPTTAVIMPSTEVATRAQVGNVNGLKWRSNTKTIFASAYARANDGSFGAGDGIGPSGLGAIYQITNGVVSTFTTISNVGTFTGSVSEVGKVGIGGIAISSNQNTLFAVNMFSKKLILIPINDNPISAGTQVEVTLPSPTSCSGTELHPFGIETYKNKVYIGMVCGGPTTSALRAYVYSYDGISFNLELDIPMNYTRTDDPDNNNTNNSANEINHKAIIWEDSPPVASYDNTTSATATDRARFAPMLTDIIFHKDNMELGFRSRLSDQIVNAEWTIGGEILHACGTVNGAVTTWQIENNGKCNGDSTILPPPIIDPWNANISARSTSRGPGGYEYF